VGWSEGWPVFDPFMSDEGKISARAHILVVEDSSVFREMQGLLLRQAGYAVSGHEHPQTALAAARERKYDLVIIDYELPEMNGQQFMHELRKILPQIAIIFVSGSLTLELAIQLSRQGVAGIFNKPANPKTLLEKINETLNRTGSREAALPGRGSLSPLPTARRASSASPFPVAPVTLGEPSDGDLAYTPQFFPGQCDAFREFTHRLWKVRDFRAVLLLQGETGTPFELIGRDLAAISIFREGPVMVCDAAEFETRHLIEVLAPSLLSQDAGTLIVTGVESLTVEQQKILQTLLTSREVFQPFARRFRLVLATAGYLSDLADSGAFDETLFYKISALSVEVPTLRNLRGDILLHVRQLLDQQALIRKTASLALSTVAARWLEDQEWAGNYGQLVKTIEFAVASTTGRELGVPALESALEQVLTEAGEISAVFAHSAPPVTALRPPVTIEETLPPFAFRPDAVATAPQTIAPATIAVPAAPAQLPSAPVALSLPAPVSPPAATIVATRTSASPFSSVPPARHATVRPSGLTARSVFRPASSAYDFSRRLAESLTTAESAS
jgi:DNA-binding NtrC family response regulator